MSSVRQQINIAAAPRAVWGKLTTTEGLMEWLVDSARADFAEGGRIVLGMEGDDGQPVEERGLFLAVKPTRLVEVNFERVGKGPWAGTRLAVQMARDGDETRVSVVHSGFPDDDTSRLESADADWKRALKALRGCLE